MRSSSLLALTLLPGILAAAVPPPTPVRQEKRALIDALASATDIPDSVSSYIASLPTEASGVLPVFDTLPSPEDVQQELGIDDEQLENVPVQILNIPSYANWTDGGWSLRLHGQAYKQPPVDNETIDHAASVFLPDLDQSNLTQSQLAQSRNITASLLAIPQSGLRINFTLGRPESGDVVRDVDFPYDTDARGEFDTMVPLGRVESVPDGNSTDQVTQLDVYSDDATTGNATAYFVPPTGITIVSDIDDILRVTQIYSPEDGLRNSFAYAYQPWSNMPEVFSEWNARTPNLHFHYLTTTPEQVTRAYVSFTYANYPPGSFETRPLNFTTVDQTFSIRKVTLTKIFESFPQRKFVLIADTSNPDIMTDYCLMASTFPDRVQCILLRNTSATDPLNKFPYDTSGFEPLDNSTWMFFREPNDIINLDLASGQCRNESIPQNVTFGYQDLPDSLSDITDNAATVGKVSVYWMMTLLSVAIGTLLV